MIIVSNDNKAKKLCTNNLCFGGVVKVVEKYWEVGLGLVCMRYCGIGYERLGNCSDRPEECLLCARPHQASKDQYSVNRYSKNPGKLCTYIVT